MRPPCRRGPSKAPARWRRRPSPKGPRSWPAQIYLEEADTCTEAAFSAEIGFAERLVWFSPTWLLRLADKIRSMSGGYEREAIRPHVLGRFTDLLLAAEGHPAMLIYLDQTISMGANWSPASTCTRVSSMKISPARSLNVATLGVRSGYTQDDVIAFANILPDGPGAAGRQSRAWRRIHLQSAACMNPARRRCWSKSYDAEIYEQGQRRAPRPRSPARDRYAYCRQARPPFRGRHTSACAGGADDEGVRRYRGRPQGSDQSDGVVRRSMDAARLQAEAPDRVGRRHGAATGITQANATRFTDGQALLGELLWRPPSPKGFPDDEASGLDGVGRRLDIANNFAERVADRADPRDVIENVFGS